MQILAYQRIQGKRRWKCGESLWDTTSNLLILGNFVNFLQIYRRLAIIYISSDCLVCSRLGWPTSWFDKDCLEAKKTLARLMRCIQRKYLKTHFFMFLYKHFHAYSLPKPFTQLLPLSPSHSPQKYPTNVTKTNSYSGSSWVVLCLWSVPTTGEDFKNCFLFLFFLSGLSRSA